MKKPQTKKNQRNQTGSAGDLARLGLLITPGGALADKTAGGRGGVRPGAGRKRGRPDRATAVQKEGLEARARRHTDKALAALVDIATKGESESARVTAAIALLDRGYGKPRQALEHTGGDGGPLVVTVVHEVIDPASAG